MIMAAQSTVRKGLTSVVQAMWKSISPFRGNFQRGSLGGKDSSFKNYKELKVVRLCSYVLVEVLLNEPSAKVKS